jgi:hypothetical protein
MSLGEKAGSQWCSKGGAPNDPRTLIIGDTTLKYVAQHPDLVSLGDTDQLMAVWGGETSHIQPFFEGRPHTYRNVENIVLLGYGMNDLCQTAPDGTQQPKSGKEKFLEDYVSMIDHIHDRFPEAIILSSDPIPRQTMGFGNARLSYFANHIAQRDPMHHHFSLAKYFQQHITKGRALKMDKYEVDGIQLKQDEVRVLIDAVHEALTMIKTATEDFHNSCLSDPRFKLKF